MFSMIREEVCPVNLDRHSCFRVFRMMAPSSSTREVLERQIGKKIESIRSMLNSLLDSSSDFIESWFWL